MVATETFKHRGSGDGGRKIGVAAVMAEGTGAAVAVAVTLALAMAHGFMI